ncbi:hypothetical protein [Synoicihabitans lomoniglobus]|nr:hypothetical protein [Opitutaceae bacterium LMO-M01]
MTGAALSIALAGCATRGPTHLYLAGIGTAPVMDRGLEDGLHDELEGFLAPTDVVVGLGYEFNTDYIWLRLAPGNELVTIKRSERKEWYRYQLPAAFAQSGQASLDLAVRAFNRMVYAAMPEPGAVGKVTRYGEVRDSVRPGNTTRVIGGLAWDQVRDRLLVLYADDGSLVAYANEVEPVETIRFTEPVSPTTLAFDSNRQRFYVPLAGGVELGEFDAAGQLLARLPWPTELRAIDAGQRSNVRIF